VRGFLVLGALFTLTGGLIASTSTWDTIWVLQCGAVFLFGALLIAATREQWKGAEWFSWSMLAVVFTWSMWSGAWLLHPFGALIALAGGGFILYVLYKETRVSRA
ncbi:MAG: hypothetical protein Q8P16_01705, partial [bacterium]|nr:hypothetical protein [bacterium]